MCIVGPQSTSGQHSSSHFNQGAQRLRPEKEVKPGGNEAPGTALKQLIFLTALRRELSSLFYKQPEAQRTVTTPPSLPGRAGKKTQAPLLTASWVSGTALRSTSHTVAPGQPLRAVLSYPHFAGEGRANKRQSQDPSWQLALGPPHAARVCFSN